MAGQTYVVSFSVSLWTWTPQGENEREVYSDTVRMVYKRKCSDRQGPEEQKQGHEPSRAGIGRIQTPLLWGIREILLVCVSVGDVCLQVCVYTCIKDLCALGIAGNHHQLTTN